MCLFINLFLQYFGGRGADEVGAEGRGVDGRGPRVEEHKHPN